MADHTCSLADNVTVTACFDLCAKINEFCNESFLQGLKIRSCRYGTDGKTDPFAKVFPSIKAAAVRRASKVPPFIPPSWTAWIF